MDQSLEKPLAAKDSLLKTGTAALNLADLNLADNNGLQQFAEAQVQNHQLPALSLAVWQGGHLYCAAAGILNINTGVTATTDSIFQIGSITKVLTTCLVMQLVDEGRVELDAPVRQYLHDFQVADQTATNTITVRQLLNHTSGMAGDFFSQDECHSGHLIARFVDRCNLLPQVNPPGAMYSYSNTAFVIAGRLVEVVRGISWYQAMQDYIYTPLGMNHAIADPKELIRFRAAMGHLQGDNGWELPEHAWLTLGMAPCGSAAMMSASDLIQFARAHMKEGQTQQGKSWLTSTSVNAMQTPEVALPEMSQTIDANFGLGWGLKTYKEQGISTYSHNGATNGFYASLQVCLQQDTVFAILLNGIAPEGFTATQAAMQKALMGIEVKVAKLDKSISLSERHKAIAGHYESFDKRITVRLEDGKLKAHLVYKMDPLPPEDLLLYPITDQLYGSESLTGERRANLAFTEIDPASFKPAYCFDGSRLNPRQA